jgi:hypothetical protein
MLADGRHAEEVQFWANVVMEVTALERVMKMLPLGCFQVGVRPGDRSPSEPQTLPEENS